MSAGIYRTCVFDESSATISGFSRTTDAGPRRLVNLADIIRFLQIGSEQEFQR